MKILILILSIIATPFLASASEEKRVTIKSIENYLNSVTTYQSSFTQIVSGSDISSGMFYMERPRKFLWQYERPYKHKIVSTGSGLFFEDGKNSQVTQLPIKSGIAGVFTRKKFNLTSGDILVHSLRHKGNYVEISLGFKDVSDEFEDSSIVMVFNTKPMQLVQLATVDPIGGRVVATFDDIKQGIKLPKDKFRVELPFGNNW